MPSERLTALLDDKTVWMIYASQWVIGRDHPPQVGPGRIDAPWHYVLGAPSWAEDLDREAWIKDVKQRLGLITCDDSEETRAHRIELAGKGDPWPDLSRSPWLMAGGQ